ncbi:hypothetical protein FQR65_LT06540 [Abscondita terminalis]|nr:hypothetical protein FQR65_LT06540 [Abscondita terminalis]
MTYHPTLSYEKEQERLQKPPQDMLSDEDKGNSFGESSSDEYEPSEDSSSDTDSDLESFPPKKKQKYKNNRSTAFQDSLPSTSSAVTGNPEANSVQQTIAEVIRNIAAQRDDESDEEIQVEAQNSQLAVHTTSSEEAQTTCTKKNNVDFALTKKLKIEHTRQESVSEKTEPSEEIENISSRFELREDNSVSKQL